LTAYVYAEDIAKKGGNNVVSLLMLHLQHNGIMQEAATKDPFKELNFVVDNCSGQNKNRHVLRLLHFLVKTQVATTARRAIFLVRGHTKNDCDRLFNTMKKSYRKTNCFTPKDLIHSMQHDKVEAVGIEHGVFNNWDELEIERKLNTGVSSRAASRDSWTTVFVLGIGAVLFGGLAGEGHRHGGAQLGGVNQMIQFESIVG
jgi:hypothetical protein